MKKPILTAAVLAAVVSVVAIPSSLQAKTKVHHRHHGVVHSTPVGQTTPPGIIPQAAQDPGNIGLKRGVALPYNECSRQADQLGLGAGQSGRNDYIRECTTGHPSSGGRTRSGF